MSRASDSYESAPTIGERLLLGALIVLGILIVFGAYAFCSPLSRIAPVPASEITSRDR